MKETQTGGCFLTGQLLTFNSGPLRRVAWVNDDSPITYSYADKDGSAV
jgi:hypothetical protein